MQPTLSAQADLVRIAKEIKGEVMRPQLEVADDDVSAASKSTAK
jgi:hypothetical protein